MLSLPDYEMSGIRKEKQKPEDKRKPPLKLADKTKPAAVKEKGKSLPKPADKEKGKSAMETEGLMKKKGQQDDFSKHVGRYDTDDHTGLTSMAWSQKRAAGKLKMQEAIKKKEEESPVTKLTGTLKTLHDAGEDRPIQRKKYADYEIPEVAPLDLKQFERAPTIVERTEELLKKAKQKRKEEKKSDKAARGRESEEEDSVIVKLVPNKKRDGHVSRKLGRAGGEREYAEMT